jgi:transcription elongation factor GreA
MNDQIISKDGYDKLQQELDCLIKEKRKEIAERIQRAKDMGDLSENAEYTEAKEAQAFNEGRIAELMTLLKNVVIVKNEGGKQEVGIGSNITTLVNGEEKKYTIVSFNEVDPAIGKISNESPLGIAFLGKKKGDKIKIATIRGEVEHEIIEVE